MLKTGSILFVIGLLFAGAAGINVCLATEGHICKTENACCATAAPASASQATEAQAEALACTLTSREKILRRDEIRKLLSKSVKDLTQDGTIMHLRFEAAQIDPVVEFIKLESDCCSFFTFTLEFPAKKANIALTIQGPPGSEVFLQAFAEAIAPPDKG